MDLILLEKNKTGYSTDLVCISEENQIYIPKVFENSPFYLKQGGTVWVKRGDVYDVFELTEDITYENYPTNKDYLDKENIMLENETFPYLDNNGKILSLKHNLYYDEEKACFVENIEY